MKNWFKRIGGYLGGGLLALLGIAGITSVFFSPGLIEGFIGVAIGIMGIAIGGALIQEQRDKNKSPVVLTSDTLKFEDRSKDDYSKKHQIKSEVRYTKNYIIEEDNSNKQDNNDNLSI